MKTLLSILISMCAIFFFSPAQAEHKGMTIHEMHAMMRLMDSALCEALEGANLQMFGQMGESGKVDKDLIERGTNMVKEGKATILNILAGTDMKTIHKEGDYNQKVMLNLHALGDRMLHVIEEVEKLHGEALKQMDGK